MKVYGQLEYADLHNLAADPSAGKVGRIYWNTVSGKIMADDGVAIFAVLRNDGKAIIGNNATAANNVRFHRGANGVLQFVTGGDTTAEGTLSTSLSALSAKIESYVFASLPASGNAGRRAWVSDRSTIYVDTGTAWIPASTLESFTFSGLPAAGTAGRRVWVTDRSAIYVDTGSAWRPASTLENFAFSSLPAAGTAGRLVWVTDRSQIYIDTGSAWRPADAIESFTNVGLPAAGTAGRLAWVTDKKVVKVDTGSAWLGTAISEGFADAGLPTAGTAGRILWVTDKNILKIDTGSGWLPAGIAESYTDAGKPAAATAGRLAWITDKGVLKLDTGSTWIPVGTAGGTGNIQWVEDVDSPDPQLDSGARVYVFGAGFSQFLTAVIRVPNSYVSGSQVRLRALGYSSGSSGTLLLNTVSTLIRTGTDAISSTTNQRTSTNAAVNLGAGTVNIPQSIVCDLTDTSGQVNGVAVSAGDLLIVKFQRATDTSTADVKALMFGFEAIFS